MDNNKKQQQNFARPINTKACLSVESNKKTTDIQTNKPWPRNSRKSEYSVVPRNDSQRNSSKQHQAAKSRPYVNKRPSPRSGGGVGDNENTSDSDYNGASSTANDVSVAGTGLATAKLAYGAKGAVAKKANLDYELNSVYAPGSKKQNLNHLLNFHCVFGRSNNATGVTAGKPYRHNQNGIAVKKHKYNKEQFLQANFQFVIKSSAQPRFDASPDTLIDWNLIEQINIQTTEEPQCPICLYPPIAAKMTRCGHAYCWPCILHYLALSDKTWRKCPICYEAIHITDLKSTTIMQQRKLNVGEEITFHLMRRKKGSMFIEKFKSALPNSAVERFPGLSTNDETKLFSKFLIAKRTDILNIIERERKELMTGEDPSSAEFVFIQQALDLLSERREKLCDSVIIEKEESAEEKSMEYNFQLDEIIDEQKFKFMDAENVTANMTSQAVYVEETTQEATEPNLSISPLTATDTTKYYYFYQSDDGQNTFLHPLNVKMLQACFDTLERAPLVINARILQKEYHSMDEDHRRKFTCLGHLPLTCQFSVVEVDLQPPFVTDSIMKLFKVDIKNRQKERQRREREEKRREKQIDEINDRQMGKLIASTASLNLSSSHEFPTCGFEEFLVYPEDTHDNVAAATPKKALASYSSVAVVGESSSTWGRANVNASTKRAVPSANTSSNNIAAQDGVHELSTLNLSDVLAEAMSQRKQNAAQNGNGNGKNGGGAATGSNKKNKKSKKMLPLFSTGMNYNGN